MDGAATGVVKTAKGKSSGIKTGRKSTAGGKKAGTKKKEGNGSSSRCVVTDSSNCVRVATPLVCLLMFFS